MGSKQTPMGSKRTSRRDLLKGGAALAGGLTSGAVAPALGQTHDHASGQLPEEVNPMIMGNKALIAYGQRSRFVTSVRIAHPIGGRPSPDEHGAAPARGVRPRPTQRVLR